MSVTGLYVEGYRTQSSWGCPWVENRQQDNNEQPTDKPTSNTLHKPVIKVQNIIPQTDSTKLRSGRTLTHSYEMTYDIVKDGERQFVDKEILQLYKRLFGSRILQYDKTLLNDPQKIKHII